uniref:Signal recognition particle subunit SRP72 n=1 Tax=Tabanus bromius TaxID=304241 RepID=A0A0K8TLY5_TABBR
MSKDASKEAVLKSAYADLNKFGQSGEYEKALKAANRILGLISDEEKALHCKVICLMQLSKFNEAVQFMEKNKLSHLLFERAYCEYRLNQPEKALKTIESLGQTPLSPGLKELKAQILYRLEKYSECFDSYKDIIKNTTDDYEDERTTNLSAVAANLAVDPNREVPQLREDTYELCFNSACVLLNQNKFSEAEKKLKICEKMCREFLEEDGASEEDIREETAIIRVQLAYCLHMQGKLKEAAAVYAEALKHKSSDPALVAVASNNLVVLNKDQNMFDSKKKMRAAMADACEHKLTSKQKKIIALNNCLLALYANSSDQCQQLCSKLIQTYPDVKFDAILIKCARLAKDKKYKEAIELLEKFGSENEDHVFASKFAIVQLMLLNGNKKGAVDVLMSLGESKYKPGVISALVTLLLGLDNKAGASSILKEAVEWHKKNNVSSGDLTEMWRQAAEFHLRGGQPETAASSLEELLKKNPKDMKVLAQLVIAYAMFNPRKAQDASKGLPGLGTLTTASEIDSLEATNWMMSTKAVKKTAARSEQSPGTPSAEAQKQKRKRNRKRKGKLPKNYNPDVPPDPERWLPKYERTGYRRKRDRRTKEVIKGSQGVSSAAADQFDMSKAQNLGKNSPAAPVHQEPSHGPRHQHRKGIQRKKKGRH